jgi:hypothetical protein
MHSARRFFRYERERICAEKGVTHAEAGARVGVSRASFTQMLAGKSLLSRPAVEVLGMHFGFAESVPRLLEVLGIARYGDNSDTPVVPGEELVRAVEAYATEIIAFDPLVVPPLAQTPAYAQALASTSIPRALGRDVDHAHRMLLQRQQAVSGTSPARFLCLLDECALQRVVGGHAVMAAQYTHLLDLAALPTVTLQIVPFEASGQAALGAGVNLVRYGGTTVAWQETWTAVLHDNTAEAVDRHEVAAGRLRELTLGPADSVALLQELRSRAAA